MHPSDPQKNHLEFKERFLSMSNDQLLEAFNKNVGNPGWTYSRAVFETALQEEFEKRGMQKPVNTHIRSKRGVFLLITKRPSGHESYISFKYKDSTPTFMPDFQLAMFNQLLFANEYLTNLEKVVKEGAPSDLPPDGPFFIQQITTQKGWDFARQKVLDDPLTKSGVLNPCDGDGDHRCIIMPIDLNEYADFEKLKDVFAGLPDTHYNLV